jgi:hypothetical protein
MSRKQQSSPSANQGEGDRRSARHFNEKEREFVESKRGQEAIRHNRDGLDAETAREARAAATKAKRRAREFDPEEERDYTKPAR